MSSGCVDYLLWRVNINHGCGPQNQNFILNEKVSENLYKQLVKQLSSITNKVSGVQTIIITNGPSGVIDCGKDSLKISQKIDGASYIKSSLQAQDISNIKSAINTEIENSLKQTNEEVIGFLANEPNALNINEVTNRIRNLVDRELTSEVISEIVNNYDLSQKVELTNYGTISGNGCEISQDIAIKLLATALLNRVSDIALQDSDISKTNNTVVQYLKTKSEGIGSLLTPLIIAGAIVFVIIVIVVIIVLFYS